MGEDVKDKIVEGASLLFHKYGVRSVSMDDIARHLAMSKKTLYQYFKDKDELVTVGMRVHMKKEKSEFEEIEEQSSDAIQEMVMVTICMRKNLSDINPSLLFDLQKYHPKAWAVWQDFKEGYIRNSVVRNLKRGVDQGLFRKEINPEIMAIFRVEQVQMAFDERIFPKDKFDFKDVQLSFLDHFIHGIVNDKGLKLLNQYLEIENQTRTKSILTNAN